MKKVDVLAELHSILSNQEVKTKIKCQILELLQGKSVSISLSKLKYKNHDYMQEINIIICNCVDNFDHNKKVPFTKYCNKQIEFMSKKYLRKEVFYNGNLSRREADELIKFNNIQNPNKKTEKIINELIDKSNRVQYINNYNDNSIFEDFDLSGITLYDIKENVLSDFEYNIIEYLIQGYDAMFISKKIGVTQRMVFNYIKDIKFKINLYMYS